MQFKSIKGQQIRVGLMAIDNHTEVLWLCAQNRIDGRLMTAHGLFPAPIGWTIEQVLAQLETFEPKGGCFVGELDGLAVGFSISSTDGDVLIFSDLEN